ncbi:MAG: DUF2577 family protein [Eubacteriales bacterium]|jgi:hypothetical protein|nr:DUF2577 family protein [Clostridiales bacterium]
MSIKYAGTAHDGGVTADIICGVVTSTSPLSVKIDNNVTLTGSALITPASIYSRTFNVNIGGTSYTGTVSSELAKGSYVMMVRAEGGQCYAIIDIIK